MIVRDLNSKVTQCQIMNSALGSVEKKFIWVSVSLVSLKILAWLNAVESFGKLGIRIVQYQVYKRIN